MAEHLVAAQSCPECFWLLWSPVDAGLGLLATMLNLRRVFESGCVSESQCSSSWRRRDRGAVAALLLSQGGGGLGAYAWEHKGGRGGGRIGTYAWEQRRGTYAWEQGGRASVSLQAVGGVCTLVEFFYNPRVIPKPVNVSGGSWGRSLTAGRSKPGFFAVPPPGSRSTGCGTCAAIARMSTHACTPACLTAGAPAHVPAPQVNTLTGTLVEPANGAPPANNGRINITGPVRAFKTQVGAGFLVASEWLASAWHLHGGLPWRSARPLICLPASCGFEGGAHAPPSSHLGEGLRGRNPSPLPVPVPIKGKPEPLAAPSPPHLFHASS
eukprot:363795-Chlamydomonas_euryale.AAC.5